MNELPKDVEQTGAFFRRFLIVPFDVRIPEDEQEPDLAQRIIDTEMSGVLNYVIKGVSSLLAKREFSIPPIIHEAVSQFRTESDSVATFLIENRWQLSSENWKTLQDLYGLYRKHCTDDGGHPTSKRTFAKRLRDLGYTIDTVGRKKQTVVFVERVDDAE
jgi:putative DNA primase/helicase